MDRLKALIFDVDGTLAETERDGHRVAFNRAFQELGLPWHWSIGLYGKLLQVGGGKERMRYYSQRYGTSLTPEILPDDLILQLHQCKNRYFKDLLDQGVIPLRPGVRRLLDQARRQGIRLAIATTSSPENAIALLQATLGPAAPTWFDVIAAGDMVPHKKPAPDVYHLVLTKLDLTPADCLVIEDSQQGLLAAAAAGLKTVVTVNDYTRNQALTSACLVISHLGEPDLPFEILQGQASQAYYFTLDLANALLSQGR